MIMVTADDDVPKSEEASGAQKEEKNLDKM